MRPTVTHDGFLIPNAADVSNPRMAEPDRIDFNTLAHLRWGVIEDCAVTVAGTQASVLGGVYVCNGVLLNVKTPVSPVPITTGGSQDRFDLIVGDDAGNLTIVVGAPAVDPVFPDVPLNRTVFAAVFVSAVGGILSDNVVDKRKLLPRSLLTKVAASSDLIRNLNGAGDMFRVDGSGSFAWLGDDTLLWRSAVATLHVRKNLEVEDLLTADTVIGESGILSYGRINGSNLQMDQSFPTNAPGAGSIFQDSGTGKIFVRQGGNWEEIATTKSANPVGTVISSMQGNTTVMKALGWYPLDGTRLSEGNPLEASAFTSLSTVLTPQGTAPNRYIVLPDFRNRMMMCSFQVVPGTLGGATNNLVALQTGHMPRHKHNTRVRAGGGANPSGSTGRAGAHVHATYGGEHIHDVNDPEHKHNGMESPIGTNSDVVGLFWGGRNKIDAYFNDRNHTFSVENLQWTMPAATGVTISTSGSGHGHLMEVAPDHEHLLNLSAIAPHEHIADEDSIGNNDPVDITPAYATVYAYIRS